MRCDSPVHYSNKWDKIWLLLSWSLKSTFIRSHFLLVNSAINLIYLFDTDFWGFQSFAVPRFLPAAASSSLVIRTNIIIFQLMVFYLLLIVINKNMNFLTILLISSTPLFFWGINNGYFFSKLLTQLPLISPPKFFKLWFKK